MNRFHVIGDNRDAPLTDSIFLKVATKLVSDVQMLLEKRVVSQLQKKSTRTRSIKRREQTERHLEQELGNETLERR